MIENILLGIILIIFSIFIKLICFNFKNKTNLSHILTRKHLRNNFLFLFTCFSLVTLYYEYLRNDKVTFIIIFIYLISLLVKIKLDFNNIFQYHSAFIIFICSWLFIIYNVIKYKNPFLDYLLILKILVLLIFWYYLYNKKKILYLQCIFLIIFVIFYLYLHYLEYFI